MQTIRWSVDPSRIDAAAHVALAEAAALLRDGGVVGFPTETVYGLGADALAERAVAKIFEAKGRPSHNPLIVHVASTEDARALVTRWPDEAESLARAFWPGPLTIVLPRHSVIPDLTTAGGPTVAVRVPSHPVALELLRVVRRPLAAPSANRSNTTSPTTAAHVLSTLDGRIDGLIDGGPCAVGLESTVISLVDRPRLLRPGGLPIGAVEAVIGPLERGAAIDEHQPLPSPGMLQKHYAPRASVLLPTPGAEAALIRSLRAQGRRVGALEREASPIEEGSDHRLVLPSDPAGYARELYAALHTLDALGVDCIVVQALGEGDAWLAIRDRLTRAAALDE